MKNVKALTVAAFGLGLLLGVTSCKGTYKPPFGGTVDWEFDPDTGDKKAAYEKLEEALKENLQALTEAAITGNEALGDLAQANIEDITAAKGELGYEPPKGKTACGMPGAPHHA